MSNYSNLTRAVMEGRRLMHAERVGDEQPPDPCVHTLQNQVVELRRQLAELQRQLAEVTAQRDGHRAILQNIRDELDNAK